MNKPPRFVPTLTEVVQGSEQAEPSGEPGRGIDTDAVQLALVQRILQRVDVTLERRLREAVGELILEHTHNLAPLLRVQIENTVREAVSLALAQEARQAGGSQ